MARRTFPLQDHLQYNLEIISEPGMNWVKFWDNFRCQDSLRAGITSGPVQIKCCENVDDRHKTFKATCGNDSLF